MGYGCCYLNPKEICMAVCIVCLILLKITLPVLVGNPTLIDPPIVENATLYTLDVDNRTSTLAYNLSAIFRFVNPEWYRVPFKFSGAFLYSGQELGPSTKASSSFKLQHDEMKMVPLATHGRQAVDGELARTYAEDAARGHFSIEARIDLDEGLTMKSLFVCTLYFPAPTAAKGAPNLFDRTECMFEYQIS